MSNGPGALSLRVENMVYNRTHSMKGNTVSETPLSTEETTDVPVVKIALIVAVATPVASMLMSKKLRAKAADFLFGPKEDFSIDPIETES